MRDEIEVADGAIILRSRDKGIQRVETPAGFTDLAFRNTVAAIQTYFLANGSLPSVDELYALWPKITRKTYAGIFATPELAVALDHRGIQWDSDSGLSMKQQMALLKLADPTDRRKLSIRLRELGVSMPEYQSWMKNPQFETALTKRTKDAFKEYLPDVRLALVSAAQDGNIQAIDRVLAITGEWDPSQREVQNARSVVLTVLQAVAKHADKATREKILADVEEAAIAVSMMRAIEG